MTTALRYHLPSFLAASCLLLLLAAALPGCCKGGVRHVEDLEKEEVAEAAMQEALAAQARGDFTKAAELFSALAVAQPFNGTAHLQLGIILQDSLDDPFAAISEYNAYLRLRPEAEKVTLVEERIKLCRDRIGKTYASLSTDIDYVGITKNLEKQIEEQGKAIEEKEKLLKFAEAEKEALKAENEKLAAELDRKEKLLDNVIMRDEVSKPSPSIFSGWDSPPSGSQEAEGEYWEHVVVRGDTLTSLAQKFYGDAARSKEIRDANKTKLGPRDMLMTGTVIRIPK